MSHERETHELDKVKIDPKVAAAAAMAVSTLACSFSTEGFLASIGFIGTSTLLSGAILSPIAQTFGMKDKERAGQINTMWAMGGAAAASAVNLFLTSKGAEIAMGAEAGFGALLGLTIFAHKVFAGYSKKVEN